MFRIFKKPKLEKQSAAEFHSLLDQTFNQFSFPGLSLELLTTKILTEERHEVEIVENGDDALERLGSEDYDVILLDIKLPGISDIELYEYIQKTVKSLAKRVIFITGDVMSKDTMSFLSKTRLPYITKPFDGEQIKKDVDRILVEGT